MLSRKPLSAAGTALIGIIALLMSPMAFAVIDMEGAGQQAVTYSQETITKAPISGEDGGSYYVVIGDDDDLNVRVEVGVGGTIGSNLIIEFVFSGMVFMTPPTLTVGGPIGTTCATAATSTASRRAGGTKGMNRVSFIHRRVEATDDADAIACLALADVAVSAAGGGITVNVSDDLPLPAAHTKTMSSAINLASSLTPTKTKEYPTALVSEKFLSFSDGGDGARQVASVGSVKVGLTATYLDARGSADAIDALADVIIDNQGNNNPAPAPNTVITGESSVTFKGDFSFASRVTLDNGPETVEEDGAPTPHMCDSAGMDTDLMMAEEDDGTQDTTQLQPQGLGYVNARPHLCITVLDATDAMAMAIPATAPYIVEKKIVLIAVLSDSRFVPMPAPAELGAIRRDGTTIRLSYLTQFSEYNQRIVIVNRGGAAAYTFTFMTEDGATATPGADAEGTLPANSITYLSLMHDDLVTIEGSPNRAAATLIVAAQETMIDVLVSQTNAGGGTDTVTYTKTDR